MLASRHHDHPRLVSTHDLGKTIPVILCLATVIGHRHVVPHEVEVAVLAGCELVKLGGHIVLVRGPLLRVFGSAVVGPDALGREPPPPEIVAVPVRNREIRSSLDSPGPVSVKEFLGYVRPRIRMEGAPFIGHLIIGLVGIEHAETVVVLGREHDIFHPRVFGGVSPLARVELDRVKSVLKVLIRMNIVEIIHVLPHPGPVLPGNIVRSQRPGLHDSPLAVGAPMDEHSELKVLPLGKPRFDIFLHRRNVLR